MSASASNRNSGYTLDVVYPAQFILSQMPVQMQWSAVCEGAPRGRLSEPFRYCDLGCGSGRTLSLLAACYPDAEFVGVDLNRDHIALADDFARRAGLDNVSFCNASFADLEDLEFRAFDYITIYGTYSWLNPSLQQAIHDFVLRRLRPGGLLGVQYASLPGAAVEDSLSTYLKALCETKPGASGERFEHGLEDLRKLMPVAKFFQQYPEAVGLIARVSKSSAGAIAHDVLNRQTHSLYFSEVYERFSALGMEFSASANLLPNYPELMMSRQAYDVYRELTEDSDLLLREATKNFILNPNQRFDLFRKPDSEVESAARPSGPAAFPDFFLRRAATRDLEARQRYSRQAAIDLTERLYTAVLELAEAPASTIADVLESSELSAFARRDIERAIERLIPGGFLQILVRPPVEAEYRHDARYRLTSRFNAIQLEETAQSTGPEDLASPILGSLIKVRQAQRLGLMALTGGDLKPVWRGLADQQRFQLRDTQGNPITSEAQYLAAIEHGLPRFAAETVPELIRLGIVEEDR